MSTLRTALIWGTGVGLLTAIVFESFSFGVAHGNGWPVFLGAVLAMAGNWPGSDSLFGVGVYQFLYCLAVALAIGAIVGMFRYRAERLAAERGAARTDAL